LSDPPLLTQRAKAASPLEQGLLPLVKLGGLDAALVTDIGYGPLLDKVLAQNRHFFLSRKLSSFLRHGHFLSKIAENNKIPGNVQFQLKHYTRILLQLLAKRFNLLLGLGPALLQRQQVVQNLGVVRDTGSVAELKKAAKDEDQDIRIAATWALGNIGDAGSADLLLDIADKSQGWERIQATKAALLLAERLLASGQKSNAGAIYKHLRDTRSDPAEKYIRDAAGSALAAAG